MEVPIIGQPKVGTDWFVVVPIECGACHARFLMAGQIGTERACPSCNKQHKFMSFIHDLKTNSVNWAIATR